MKYQTGQCLSLPELRPLRFHRGEIALADANAFGELRLRHIKAAYLSDRTWEDQSVGVHCSTSALGGELDAGLRSSLHLALEQVQEGAVELVAAPVFILRPQTLSIEDAKGSPKIPQRPSATQVA
jgi:hypothetical protein